ncbi:imidazole glycerol phosphate synthase subunit HisF [Pendulispora rubella]|uniref:Imidazole glycerol phosphate synthase subunit HisF n=1 Tax=Pendulispora rubella TaxID=2741070 RepID=A0ABZ2KWB4_9BACT
MSAKLRRVVVCLDVDAGRVKKGVRFESLRDVGCPVELAARYEAEGADEIVLLDVSATVEGRATLFDVVRRTAERLFIPLTMGGGVRTVEDFERALRAGADKVGINSAAVADPELITRASERFGAQCVVLSIDARKNDAFPSGYNVVTHGGRKPTDLDAIAWAKRGVELGAGEILLTSIDRDGVRSGYDLELTRAVVRAVTVPVVASGGAGNAEHVASAFADAGADAALVAGILHDGETTVGAIKSVVRGAGIEVRA